MRLHTLPLVLLAVLAPPPAIRAAQAATIWADGVTVGTCASDGPDVSCPVDLVKGQDYNINTVGDGATGTIELVNGRRGDDPRGIMEQTHLGGRVRHRIEFC